MKIQSPSAPTFKVASAPATKAPDVSSDPQPDKVDFSKAKTLGPLAGFALLGAIPGIGGVAGIAQTLSTDGNRASRLAGLGAMALNAGAFVNMLSGQSPLVTVGLAGLSGLALALSVSKDGGFPAMIEANSAPKENSTSPQAQQIDLSDFANRVLSAGPKDKNLTAAGDAVKTNVENALMAESHSPNYPNA